MIKEVLTIPLKKIAVMTGGGDCPGLNAVIRSVVLAAAGHDMKILGIHNGWQGLIEGDLEEAHHCFCFRHSLPWRNDPGNFADRSVQKSG